jgi:23S rRNA (cytosine1962-C5)-methyltransferase
LTVFRLFHGDADGTPGLALDRYGSVAVIHADSAALLEACLPGVRAALGAEFGSAYAKVHPRITRHLADAKPTRLAPSQPMWGSPTDAVVVTEFDVLYEVRPARSPSVGLFLDMRDVRQWVRSVSSGLEVLNLFAYTCAFGVCASRGGALRVLNLDLSRNYLDWGKTNYALNGMSVDARDFVYGDAFDWLRRFARRAEQFDLVIVDPPSFSSTPFSVKRDYSRLISAAARVVSPGGLLLAATNHTGTSEQRFETWLTSGISEAGRHGHVVRRWHEPEPDFPIASGRSPYLKVRAVRLD